MLIETVLRNGYKFVTQCEELYTSKNKLTGGLSEVKWSDIKTGKPIWVNIDEVVAIIRLDDCSKEYQE